MDTEINRSGNGEELTPQEQTQAPKESKWFKKTKEPKSPKTPKEPKAPKAPKEPKTPKAPKEPKTPKAPKEPKAPKAPKEPKPPKAPKEPKPPKAPKEPKPPKAPKEPKPPKAPKEPKVPKTPKQPKTLKVKEPKEEKTSKKQSKFLLFSIRNKIILCFLIPIVFMVVIGVSAYSNAADGMSDKFLESAQQAVNMASEYIGMGCNFVDSEAQKYAYDKDLAKYFLKLYDNDVVGKSQLMNNVKANIVSSESTNRFINNIFIIPKSGVNMLASTSTNNADGFFDEYKETVFDGTRSIWRWVDGHDMIDEAFSLNRGDYIMACQVQSQSANACVVIDVKTSTIHDFLADLDLGEGSIVGFVTSTGREIICEELPEGAESALTEGEAVFFGQSFFPVLTEDSEEEFVYDAYEVDYRDQDWLFLYNTNTKTGATVCALVPMEVIIGQAEQIRSLTVGLVVLAVIVVLVIGFLIAASIQNNMRRISKKLGVVAEGDLTVQVHAKGRDEFRGLADSANHMIRKTKKLVNQVRSATEHLETSSHNVEKVSGVISEYSLNITEAVDEINHGMSRQSRHAQQCVTQTDVLSTEIQEVSRVVEEVGNLVAQTEEMIDHGMEIVQLLGSSARETTSITVKVSESIESLRRETETINTFVDTITEISDQTNLLSLNASIEAARAGAVGRGFAVVAEEIRKLADNSAKAAGEISNNVEKISAKTVITVESAKTAQNMVAAQTEAVDQAVRVFQEMQQQMNILVDGLKDIVNSTEKADQERSATVDAVQDISDIIEQTAHSAEVVRGVVAKLMENVENLNHTADDLGNNMESLQNEISAFKL